MYWKIFLRMPEELFNKIGKMFTEQINEFLHTFYIINLDMC